MAHLDCRALHHLASMESISIAQNELLSRRNAEVTVVTGIFTSSTPEIDVEIGVQFAQHDSSLEKGGARHLACAIECDY
ncbi:hypothetical protein [Undibacterium sp. RuTC16W]|uniref:hypothetical protein n=1 Tax=Undibacterium sp. RuTC16W TaxID=3413048 RepID=UPI003BF1AF56